ERADEVVLPGPAGGEMQRPLAGGAGQPAGDLKQAAAQRASGADGVAGQSDEGGPAGEVVREAGDHGPGAVGGELAGGEVLKGLVFEIADRELDDGVLTVLGLDDGDLLGAVGEKREVAPVGPQLGLRSDKAGAPDDHPLASEPGLGDLRLAVLGV